MTKTESHRKLDNNVSLDTGLDKRLVKHCDAVHLTSRGLPFSTVFLFNAFFPRWAFTIQSVDWQKILSGVLYIVHFVK